MKSRARAYPGLAAFAVLCSFFTTSPATAQVAGQNVNMVSGTQWPGGDPFLQRQNEPSIAVSSRNPFHLLAGANDYRSVDLALELGQETGDAWLGLFKSLDGGATWRSILLPGCPYNTPICGGAPQVKNGGYQAAADPVVRAGTNGMFYYAGLVFNRGANGQSAIIVSRLIDLNNEENADPNDILNGDAIQYLSTSVVATGTSQRFLDKPTLAVDIPRAGASTCNLTINQPNNGSVNTVHQSFAAGNVYVTYTAFDETTVSQPNAPQKSYLFFTRSGDCGATWSKPLLISGNVEVSQGSAIAIDPVTGSVYVAWREFHYQVGNVNQPDAMVVVGSTNQGQSFSVPMRVTQFAPFDEGTSNTSFRTNAYPTLAVDDDSRIYLAYAARNAVPSGDARIVLTTSSNGGNSWTSPHVIDNPPVNAAINPSGRGHQIMPALSYAGGKITLLYYDLRLDHTFGKYSPIFNQSQPTGLYSVLPELAGELVTTPPMVSTVFGKYIDDAGLTLRRHTFDLRVAQAAATSVPVFGASTLVSQYAYGCCAANQTDIEQLEFNVPNLPMFVSGTAPFMGDYVDIAPSPQFLPPAAGSSTGWQFNLDGSTATTAFHAAWTDNRDVQAPPDGDWTKYTPPLSPSLGNTSISQPGQTIAACQPGYTGTRNQNIYTSKITPGLVFGAPSNAKTLGTTVFNNQTVPFQRAFSLIAQNTTNLLKSYRLTIANQPPGGSASFLQFSQLTTLDVSIAPQSSATRPVFVESSVPNASVVVSIAEITAPQGTLVTNGLSGSTTLNPDITNPAITNPAITNPAITNPAITNFEVTNPAITNPAITNPAITNPAITNPAITNPAITNSSFQNVSVVNPAITNPAITNPAITNASIANPAITNPAITNIDPANASVSDTQWTVTNTGNTTGSYAVKLATSATVPQSNVLQLIVTKTYQTPAAPTGQSCSLAVETHSTIVTNVVNPTLLNPADPAITNPAITNPAITNPTVALAPGESANIDLRVINPNKFVNPTFSPAQSVVPVMVAQAVNTQAALSGGSTATPPITVPPLAIVTTTLPDGVNGTVYTATVQTQGGNPTAHTFSIVSGTLPAGLTLGTATGAITGVPSATGTFAFTVQAQDVGSTLFPQHTTTQSLTIRVAPPLVVLTTTLPGTTQGGVYTQVLNFTGGTPPVTFALTTGSLPAGLTLSGGIVSGVPTGTGSSTFTIQAKDSSVPPQVVSQTYTITVASSGGTGTPSNVTFVSQPQNSVGGQILTGSPVTVQVTDVTGAALPGVTVSVVFNGTPPCSAATLGGTLAQLTNASGVASFPNLTVDRGQLGYTLLATAGNATGVSSAFTVSGFCGTTSLSTPRELATEVLLPNGKVLFAGGVNNSSNALSTAEIFDPVAGTVTPTGNLVAPNGRANHATVPLSNGTFLLIGGVDAAGNALNTAEIYNPASGTFSATGSMAQPRTFVRTVVLPNGLILVAGGSNSTGTLASAEIYNVATGAFTSTGNLNAARERYEASLLPNGKALLAGGRVSGPNGFTALSSAEIFDPAANGGIGAFTSVGNMNSPRDEGNAISLSNGMILLTGGFASYTTGLSNSSAEIFDWTSNTFTPTGSMNAARTHHTADILQDGTVLIAGGVPNTGTTTPSVSTAELYNPSTGTFGPTGSLIAQREYARTVILPNGYPLVSGGDDGVNTTATQEIYYSNAPQAPLLVTTTALMPGTQNVPYTQILQQQGAIGGTHWTLASGTLPTGMSLGAAGRLSGTPTVSGTFTFVAQVTDNSTPAKTATSGTLTLTIASATTPLAFASQTLPTAFTGRAYSASLATSASGGTTPYTFAVISGSLPPGVTLGTNGAFSGTPTTAGSANFTVKVTDSSTPTAQTATQTFTIQTVNVLAITTTSLPNGTAGTAYSANISSSGGTTPVTFSVTSGSLPTGLSLSLSGTLPQTAVLSGTPTTAGTFTFTVTAADSSTPVASASQGYTVTIAPAVLPPAHVAFVAAIQNSTEGQLLTGSPVKVLVTDSTNTALPGVPVTMSFNATPPCAAATLGGTLSRTTDATGTATFPDLTINRGQFGFALAASAGGITAASNAFNVEGYCDTGSMSAGRHNHDVLTLPNGKVLVAGGATQPNGTGALASAELYDPVSHTFSTIGSMNAARVDFTMTLLTNGKVLVAGGFNDTTVNSSAELFDPTTNSFTLLTGAMTAPRSQHTATLLSNGKVLIAGGNTTGGTTVGSAELFDPSTNTFSASTHAMNSVRQIHHADLLPNGQVLIEGGFDNSNAPLASAEIYDPTTDTFTATGSMSTARGNHASAVLYTGKVLVAGGLVTSGTSLVLTATAELYDPSTGAFTSTASMSVPRGHYSGTVLTDGTVFIPSSATLPAGINADIFDPGTGTFRVTGNFTTVQAGFHETVLPDGTVLLASGINSSSAVVPNSEIYYPASFIPVSITTVLPTALLNLPYSQQLQQKGGVGTLTWSVTSGTLPAGLALSPSGLLSGAPTAVGASLFTVQVTDSSSPPRTAMNSYALAVVPQIVITPALPDANPGVAYSQVLTVVGGTSPYTFSLASGSLPSGLALASNGTVSGTTTTGGTFIFKVKVLDSSAPPVSTTQAVAITVAAPLTITTSSLSNGTVGTAYSQTITTSGGVSPIVFLLSSGSLPPGVTLGGSTGTLSGTPSAPGTFTFSITAGDASASTQIATQSYTVVITGVVTPLTLGPSSLAPATLGVAYNQAFTIGGGVPPYTVTESGALPGGLIFSGSSNPPAIAGTPTATGTFSNIVVTVKDSQVPAAQQQITYSLTVNAFTASCGSGSESALAGQYAFLFQGFGSTGPQSILGSFTADGTGKITAGQVDVGGDNGTGGGVAQSLQLAAAQSSYSVGSDLRGCLTLATASGAVTFRFALGSLTNGVAAQGDVVEFRQGGTFSAGVIKLQDPSAFSASKVTGPYAFEFATPSSLTNVGHWGVLGSFTASGGSVSGGSWDFNDTNTLDGLTTWPATALSFPAGETYTVSNTGRGTIMLPSVKQYSQGGTLASANYVFYVVSASELLTAIVPDANNEPLTGTILQQSGAPFSALNIAGAGYVNGVSHAPTAAAAWVGTFNANQGTWSSIYDNDSAGVYTQHQTGGTYTVGSNGRVPLAFSGANAGQAPMVYIVNPNKVLMLLADGTAAAGVISGSGSGAPGQLAGTFALGSGSPKDRSVTNESGIAVFDGAGNVSFTADQAINSTAALNAGVTLSKTYAYDATTGRGVIPATGTPNFVFYAQTPQNLVLLDVTSTDPTVETLISTISPAGITLSPNPLGLFVNSSGTMTVTLTSPAGNSGQVVSLSSSNSAVASVPSNVTVAAGATTATFQVTTGGTQNTATITATATGFNTGTATVSVTNQPMLVTTDGPLLATGRSFGATVTLLQPAPSGGLTVTLTASPSGIITIAPANVTIPAGQSTAQFTLTAGSTGSAVTLTASAPGLPNATATLNVTSNLISFGTIPVIGPAQTTSLPVNLSFAAPPGGLTINFTSANPGIATVTPSVFVPAGLQIASSNPQVTGVAIGTTSITATATGFAPDNGAVTVTVTASLNPNPISVNAGRTAPVTLTISAAAPAGGITFNLASDSPNATVPASVTVAQGQLSASFGVTGVTQGSANLTVTSTGITTVTAPISIAAHAAINFSNTVVGNNLLASPPIGLSAPALANQNMTITSADPTHFLLSTSATGAGAASITLPLTAGSTGVPTFYLQGKNFTGSTAITATLTASSAGYTDGVATMSLYPSGLTYYGTNSLSTTTFSTPTTLTAYLVVLTPGTLNFYTFEPLGPQATSSVPVAITSTSTGIGNVTGSPASIAVGAYYTQAISFVPAGAGTTNLNLATPAGYSTPANVPVQIVATVSAPAINLNATVVGNNLMASVSAGLAAAPPSNETLTLTSSDATHFLLSTSTTTVGTASITVPLTAGTTSIPTFYVQGQNFTGSTAINATLTASAPGFATGTTTLSLYPSGLTYYGTNSFSTTTFSGPTTLTVYLVALSPGTLNFYTFEPLGPQAASSVPVAVTSTNTGVGKVTGSPTTIGVGAYYTQAMSFVPAGAGTTNLNLATPTGYSTPGNVPVQIVATVSAPTITVSAPVVGNNLITSVGITLGAAPPSNETMTITSGDPTHFLLSTSATSVGSSSVTVQLTGGSASVPAIYVEGQNFSGSAAITATLTVSAPGFSNGTAQMSLYPSGLTYYGTSARNTTTFSPPTTLTVYLVVLTPGTLNFYTFEGLGPQAPSSVPVAVTSTNTSVGTVTGSPSSIGVGAYYTQAVIFTPSTAGTTNLNLATPSGYSTPANVPVQIATTVTAPAITVGATVVGNNLIASLNPGLGAAPPSNETMTLKSSDPTHFLLSTSATTVGAAQITVPLTAGSGSVPAIYIQGQNFSGSSAITATLTASAAGYTDGTATMSLYPSGLTYYGTTTLNTTTTSGASTLTIYLAALSPGTLNFYTFESLGPQAPGGSISVSVTSTSTSVGNVAGSPAAITVGAFYTQAISFVPATTGTTNLNLATPSGYSTPSNVSEQIVVTVQ